MVAGSQPLSKRPAAPQHGDVPRQVAPSRQVHALESGGAPRTAHEGHVLLLTAALEKLTREHSSAVDEARVASQRWEERARGWERDKGDLLQQAAIREQSLGDKAATIKNLIFSSSQHSAEVERVQARAREREARYSTLSQGWQRERCSLQERIAELSRQTPAHIGSQETQPTSGTSLPPPPVTRSVPSVAQAHTPSAGPCSLTPCSEERQRAVRQRSDFRALQARLEAQTEEYQSTRAQLRRVTTLLEQQAQRTREGRPADHPSSSGRRQARRMRPQAPPDDSLFDALSGVDPTLLAAATRSMSIVEAALGDPVKGGSPRLRVFALAFDSEDVVTRGGIQGFKHLIQSLVPGLEDEVHFSLKARQSMFGLKCLKVTFTSIEHAGLVYKKFLEGFILAYATGRDRDALPPLKNLPRPSFWRGPRAQDGFDWGELPGLVRWTLKMPVNQALQEVYDRVLLRLDATRETLPLFVDTNFVAEVSKNERGEPVTVVEVMAFQETSALLIAPLSDIQVSAAVSKTLLHCSICRRQGHQRFTCPAAKLRVRLRGQALNLNVRRELTALLHQAGFPVRIWGGRDPDIGHESRRFGYLSFETQAHSDAAELVLAGPNPLWWAAIRLGPPLRVETGLLANECPLCGSNDRETRHKSLHSHKILETCPLSRGHDDQPISVEMLEDVNAQVPESLRTRQTLNPNSPTGRGGVRL